MAWSFGTCLDNKVRPCDKKTQIFWLASIVNKQSPTIHVLHKSFFTLQQHHQRFEVSIQTKRIAKHQDQAWKFCTSWRPNETLTPSPIDIRVFSLSKAVNILSFIWLLISCSLMLIISSSISFFPFKICKKPLLSTRMKHHKYKKQQNTSNILKANYKNRVLKKYFSEANP